MSQFNSPEFPPLLKGHTVLQPDQPQTLARELADSGELEPGAVFWLKSEKDLKLAFYLEPEVSLRKAGQIIPVAMVAFADSMGAITHPEFAIHFVWPGTIYANKGKVGNICLLTPDNTSADEIPDWMILCFDIALQDAREQQEPGLMPDLTNLYEEGCSHLSSVEIIESLSRHFLTWLHIWEEDGFQPVHKAWLFRTLNLRQEISCSFNGTVQKGLFLGMDEDGGALVQINQETICWPLYMVQIRT